MQLIETISSIKSWSNTIREKKEMIAFVPTMGALHEGHLSLVRLAKQNANHVVVSIFVNPLQFGPKEDFERYPRTLEKDLELLKKEDVDIVFLPTVKEIYPDSFQTSVEIEKLSDCLCGKSRAGHFKGVATVVLKLFNIVNPHVAVFGDKDFQQRVLIERMVQDLCMDIEIIGAPIVRETDGLAVSSRNIYLSQEERKRATVLNRSLMKVKMLVEAGERNATKIISEISQMIDKERPTHVDYIKICDTETLEEVSAIEKKVVVLLATYFGKTRLIDNIVLNP